MVHLLKLDRKTGWLSLVLWLLTIVPAQAQLLRVAVAKKIPQVGIASSTQALVSDETGRKLGELQPLVVAAVQASDLQIVFEQSGVKELWVTPQPGGYIWIGDRWYRGTVQIIPDGKDRLMAIDRIELEHYLYSVLGAEMSEKFPAEALKAQAVAARTYAIYRHQAASKKSFDLDSSQESQVYRGIASEAITTQAAVDGTKGQIMTYQGKPILAVFHSASGGHTENVENIWTNALPYLRGVPDSDLGTPGYQWTKTFTTSELSQLLKVPKLRSVTAERLSAYGSVLSLTARGESQKTFTGKQIHTSLNLRSQKFTISPTTNGFIFNGRGYGHTLGLSQWGAYNMAQQGMSYTAILNHYYRGVNLSQLAPDTEPSASVPRLSE